MYWGDDWTWPSYRQGLRFALTLVTPPVALPIDLEDAKAHARIDGNLDDAEVDRWIRAAVRKVEQDTDIAMLTQTWALTLNGFPWSTQPIGLMKRPIQSVESVKYYDSAGVQQTWAAGNYVVDLPSARIGLTGNITWPGDLRVFQPVTIQFIAGFTDPDLVPEDLKQAVRMLVAHFSENRQPALGNDRPEAIALGYDSLISPYRIEKFA